jgi:hypothetical protein
MQTLKDEGKIELAHLKLFPDQADRQAKAKESAKISTFGEILITTIKFLFV